MSLGKLPVIGWVSGSHGKRRLKSELTPDMISPPLGDFRHTMHVGRGGDVFGDTSFLSNHGGTETAKANNFFARTLRHVRRTPLRNRGSGGKAEASPAPPAISPIIKNAVSLPQLSEGTFEGASPAGKFAFKSIPNSVSDTHYAYGLESGFCTIPRAPRSEKTQESSFPAESELQRSDSLLSFRLDLGPSLMSELLQVMSFTEAKEESEEDRALTGCQAVSPLSLHGEWVEDGVPRGSGTPHASRIDGDMVGSLWGHSRQGASPSGTSLLSGHLMHVNGDAHAIKHAEEGPAYAGGKHQSPGWGSALPEETGALPKDTLWQGHWNDCSMAAGAFNRAAQALARHYSGRGARPSLEEEEEGPREARTQASWESPAVSSWRAEVEAERRVEEAGWSDGEEEEEEAALSGVREGDAMAGEGCSDSFEYADEEEEDDEVKV
ncbi:cdc42 effector protein 1 [Emydura macquarii macquarii]|uniref:cdc42 effector protein 1 n=1 Tax=Emydura macquarii macquarii TaxID=1129001 RepID=UPI00352BBA0B